MEEMNGDSMTDIDESIKELLRNPEFQQRLAKYIAERCFRNSLLEDFHTGKEPETETGDYSDVFVTTPSRQIPWVEISRISDEEMKLLMQNVVNQTYRFVQELLDEERSGALMLKIAERDPVPQWDDPDGTIIHW